MNLRYFLLVLSIIFVSGVLAQKKQNLSQINTLPSSIAIKSPILLDSVNMKGEKYGEKDLLKTEITIPDQKAFIFSIKSDTAGYFMPPKSEEGSAFQLFSFYVSSDRYGKGTLKVTSPNMLEVYVDGKLTASKTTKENHLSSAKDVSTTLNSYPLNSRVVIKLLSSVKDKATTALKVTIENETTDSLTNFAVSDTNKRFVNFTDMMLGKRVTGVSMSPKGQYVLISFRNTYGEKSASTTELYEVKTGKSLVVDTDGTKKQLGWMPKTEKLFYLQKDNEEFHLTTIDPITLEENIIARNIPNQYLTISPDEKSLYYYKQEKGDEPKSDLKLLKSVEDRQPGFSNRSFIYRYDLLTGLNQQLTFGTNTTRINDISSDSKYILFSIYEDMITERPFSKSTLYMLNVETMKVDTIWANQTFVSRAAFSPDMKKLLIQGSGEAFDSIGLNVDEGQIANSYNGLAFIMDLETKKVDPISKEFDPSIDYGFWNKKGDIIYFNTTDKDCVNIYSYDLSSKRFSKLPLKEEVTRSFSVAKDGEVAAYFGLSHSNSTRAYLYDLKKQESKLIADPYGERLSQMTLAKVEDWNFTNSVGTEIKGTYYLPPNFDPSKKYPMIVYYYGGTAPTSRTFEAPYPAHVFAAQGYVTYIIQPSGATGFGQKFAALHVNAWGHRTAEDIIEGTKQFMKEHTFVDETKIGCIGASYGGFMTMYLQTKTDMFAAAVSHAGISSISSYWGEGYWGYSYSSGASAHSYPWNNRDLYVNQSPLFNADKVKTPILFTHGTVDTNVPIGESIQMYTALQILGVPSAFIQVKDENHGVANYKRRVEWNNSIMAWFDKWLKGDDRWWKGLYPDNK
ncbi:prolyl oligopeptidase family serine peptidase [Dysgonomonas sp. Marseille-P4361]|uniref:S9 family peptidase n=1 Tax=Dysgonomonas sp. Marseille-P4361 TaxID=2161820 RepID=UPI000D54D6AA|nr:prolyl oligopeptidase family serine peptidase [Dysgonomonas sp. Marseille-P4361]